ncbi:MAG: DUF1015 domain-containing protein [Deltaproteobacteria bacterium]|nr:DUF1015 domain-containing protein [Deltaproteobacteria bacterium]
MRIHDKLGLGVPEVLLPKPGIDLHKWAVIACDQHTSEPAYWSEVAALVGDAPSTLHLVYPEVYLGEAAPEARIERIRATMRRYYDDGVFVATPGFVYVERSIAGRVRHGLMVCLDLEQYDFRVGSHSPIRATEGTILDRIPPRVKIREGATVELPHIMVLIDDPDNHVLGPLTAARERLPVLYDVELMLGSGHVSGRRVDDPALEAGVVAALTELARPEVFAARSGVPAGTPVLLYAMGDGNHSLATAKTIWERAKERAAGPAERAALLASSPLRHALVELTNLHDHALEFEPIHRVLFDLARDLPAALAEHYPGRTRFIPLGSFDAVRLRVDAQHDGSVHLVGLVTASAAGVLEIDRPGHNLPVGTLQPFLDAFMQTKGAREIDYVHGADAVTRLGSRPGAAGLYLPAMRKQELFRSVALDGALPRKTFSMGEAHEKRFYLEARRIA